jgi:hypothetical protein
MSLYATFIYVNYYSYALKFNPSYVLLVPNDRYIDMIANPEVADVFRTRAKVFTTSTRLLTGLPLSFLWN